MPRPSPYTDKQKAAILEAVKADRMAGKKWPTAELSRPQQHRRHYIFCALP